MNRIGSFVWWFIAGLFTLAAALYWIANHKTLPWVMLVHALACALFGLRKKSAPKGNND